MEEKDYFKDDKRKIDRSKTYSNKKGDKTLLKYATHVEPFLHLLAKWKSMGMSESEMFRTLRISESTWHRCKTRVPEMLEYLNSGKRVLGMKLEAIGLKRAMEEGHNVKYWEKMIDANHPDYNKSDKGSIGINGITKLEVNIEGGSLTEEEAIRKSGIDMEE